MADLPHFDFFDPDFQADPYPTYAKMRRSGPVCRVDPFGAWTVSRYADVIATLRSTQQFSSTGFREAFKPPWLEDNPGAESMLVMDPPEHTKLRSLVSRAFSAAVVSRTEPRVREIAGRLADDLQSRGSADFVADFAVPLTAGVIGDFLTVDRSLHADFKRWTDDLLTLTPTPPSPEHAARVRGSVAEMRRYLGAVIEERRRAPGPDIVSELMQAEVDGQSLSDEDILRFLFLLLPAGFDTTSNLMSKCALMLAQRPEDRTRLREDPTRIPAFVEEMLRYDPPAHCIYRTATGGAEIASVKVPDGAFVMINLASANRDETQFENPDVFDMDRDTQGMVAFGHGAHFCVGHLLARLEAKVAIEVLLDRFERLEVTSAIEWRHSLTVRSAVRVPVRAVPA